MMNSGHAARLKRDFELGICGMRAL